VIQLKFYLADMYSASRNKEEAQTAVVFEDLDNFCGQTFQQILYVGGADSDEVSDPTAVVQEDHTSFSEENLSIFSEKSFLTSYDIHIPYDVDDTYDLSVTSSIYTKALHQIDALKMRLRTQENTKVEVLNQCLKMERRLEDYECKLDSLQECKAHNHQLRETNTKMEHDFMNVMNDIVAKMAEKEEQYCETLQGHEQKIRNLEEELRLLKEKINLDDDASTIETIHLSGSLSLSFEYDERDGKQAEYIAIILHKILFWFHAQVIVQKS
jgi:hypothetical protein